MVVLFFLLFIKLCVGSSRIDEKRLKRGRRRLIKWTTSGRDCCCHRFLDWTKKSLGVASKNHHQGRRCCCCCRRSNRIRLHLQMIHEEAKEEEEGRETKKKMTIASIRDKLPNVSSCPTRLYRVSFCWRRRPICGCDPSRFRRRPSVRYPILSRRYPRP